MLLHFNSIVENVHVPKHQRKHLSQRDFHVIRFTVEIPQRVRPMSVAREVVIANAGGEGANLAVVVSVGVHSCGGGVGIWGCQVDCFGTLQGFLGSLGGIASHDGAEDNQSKSLQNKTHNTNSACVIFVF
jgi:hypothetical protein